MSTVEDLAALSRQVETNKARLISHQAALDAARDRLQELLAQMKSLGVENIEQLEEKIAEVRADLDTQIRTAQELLGSVQ